MAGQCCERTLFIFLEVLCMLEFSGNLKEMNHLFRKNGNIEKDKFKKPFWLGDDPLKQIYENLNILYQSGKVVYAFLVQANEILFKRFPPFNCPANIIFSLDEFYKSNPMELQNISQELYSYKNEGDTPPEIKQITDSITDEMNRLFNIPIPLDITENKQVYFTTIMVHRNHLPKGKLISSLFPVVCDLNSTNTSIILPKKYWTKDFICFYNGPMNMY